MQQIDVEIQPLPPRAEVEALWRGLESRAAPSFFTSWSWIGTWLESLPADVRQYLWVARITGEVVGLGLLSRRWRKRGPMPVCEAWYLNATGDVDYDIVWIEHNDLLVDVRFGDDVRAAMVGYWRTVAGPASELHLPGLTGDGWAQSIGGDLERVADVQASGCVALGPVREKQLDFTPLVSGHARRFIRRSLKEYQTLGPLSVTVADNVDEANVYLHKLTDLHQSRWTAKGEAGVFSGNFFVAFHRRLIARCLPRGEVQLLRVRAGERDIGYLYSFIRGPRLYVYQSGFDYGLLQKHGRPGLITHTLAIQHNASLGFDAYDLMAGESQYKSTLSTVCETMSWVVLRKPALRFKLENGLKELAERYLRGKEIALPAEEKVAHD